MNTAHAADAIAGARARNAPLRIVSGGAWLDANRPVRAEQALDLSHDRGITAYEPGDLTVTARAGTTLRELANATRAARQWLPLDPYGSDEATIGAVVATGSFGPLSSGFGGPRDMTLGLEMVSGSGLVVNAGGRVVKNVAGFDLVRLATGSWGSLGAITEVTVRVRALPQRDLTLALPLTSVAQVEGIRNLAPMPSAAELLSPRIAESLGLGALEVLLVRLTGSEVGVLAQRAALAAMTRSDPREESLERWTTFRAADNDAAVIVRISALPSELPRLWGLASACTASFTGAWCSAQLARGIVRMVFPRPGDVDDQWARDLGVRLRALAAERVRVVYERLPAAMWPSLAPSPLAGALARGIKARFDPHAVMNPGIWGEPS